MTQPDMNQLMQQAQQMQAQLQEAQREIAASTVKGEAGNGLVTISIAGTGEVTDMEIDPKIVDPEDIDTLKDLLLGAFKDANQKLQTLAEEKMGPLSQGMGGLGF
ncbi:MULTISPECIES: YbaB/EbfC family nucleoid-associated protein [Corynebacterium]|uniref:YbaB/EbfC family nucleoid-associated protein n=1 Tax=Corynebacterium TaxID=1716 RepID=UPI0005570929|nr:MULTISPECIES: YbaB/EbfC family nucleoid-associated protein [Corynebacterium]MBC6794912.1 nucleoid-associated protein, YbaB/EbfC family [Corynebacterium sp. LK28]MDK8870363.1 YbaB/EbfC family nucleoid-associated protein [Corynebacterium macclintockiae]MDK8891068.1 YbaB/EbfC family nucleoid-associated protein [Corynebacterium macclintockiae]OFM61465.1 transcriptional regulator [Corynebacterium sp. HMSC058E07]